MAPAWLLVTALCAFCANCFAHPGAASLAQRPELAAYQDIGKCLYRGSTWYVLYRSVKQEEAFGADDRCLRDTQTSEVVDGKAHFRYRFGDGHER
ncbi:hypothetical protein MTO96_041966 [Rhipicephalus appendiculatus]